MRREYTSSPRARAPRHVIRKLPRRVNLLSIEEIDLPWLAQALKRRFGGRLAVGYLDGKTILRDAVAAQISCSDVQAEELVETLELHGLIRFPRYFDETHPQEGAAWELLG